MSQRIVKVGLVQSSAGPDPRANVEKTAKLARELARRGASIICLQELFASEYFCQREDAALFDLAEAVPGPTTQAMAEVAKDTGTTILTPVFERRAAGVYHNSLAVMGPKGEMLGLYRKMHIPDDPLFYEKFY